MADNTEDAAPEPPAIGAVRRYAVRKANGKVRHQLVLVTGAADEHGAVRGLPIGFEDDAARFLRGELAD